MANPFRRAAVRNKTVPTVLIIFGVSGDLAHRYLLPSLYNLALDGLLPANFSLVGAARRDFSDDIFRQDLRDSVATYSRRKPLDAEVWREFAGHSYYVKCPFDDAQAYQGLAAKLDGIDQQAGVSCVRIFYLATAPEYFEVIARELSAAGLLQARTQHEHRPRVIVEKPFGYNAASAAELNRALLSYMEEPQVFRIDHYLGKETVQNLSVFRFCNGIFEPLWNRQYIEHVEISVCESLGVGSRGVFFDGTGVLRDVVQNHALQLLCLVASEPPVAMEADALRDEKVKVLRAVQPLNAETIAAHTVRAQYAAGFISGEPVPCYIEEKGVAAGSLTETYAALQLFIDNWRWAGVPFYIRAGKRLAKRVTEISVHFKKVPYHIFPLEEVPVPEPNVLSFQIQPDEGISIRISSKPPGLKVRVQTVSMDFRYGTSFGIEPPNAYERLLLDCMRGDASLFARADEIEAAWNIVDPVLKVWSENGTQQQPMCVYEAGSWGPKEAEQLLLKQFARGWHRL